MKFGPLVIKPQRIAVFVGVIVLLFLIMDFNGRMDELIRLKDQDATVQAHGTDVILTQYALQTQAAYATSPAAVEDYARGQAHMAQPGDQVVVPLPVPDYTPSPQPTPTMPQADLSNLDVWMQVLFGK